MSADDNINTIRGIYDALGRGDVGFILDSVTDDVDWATDTVSTAAPWCGPRHGKAGVATFFEALATTNLHHLFRFRDGKIAYCRSAEDTAQVEEIFRD